MEELNVDYELKIFKRGSDMLAPPELKEVHPLGKSPVVGIQAPGAEKPLILAESGAIVEYLTEYFGKHLIPKRYPEGKEGMIGAETEEWLRYRYFMHYAEGSLMTLMLIALFTMSKWQSNHSIYANLTCDRDSKRAGSFLHQTNRSRCRRQNRQLLFEPQYEDPLDFS